MALLRRLEPGLKLRMKNEARRIAEQHRRLEELRDEVTAALTRLPDGACDAFATYAEALEAHFAVEERFYFPAIHGLDAELERTVDALLAEHERIRSQVDELLGHFAGGDHSRCSALLAALLRDLQTHERTEEWAMKRAGTPS